MRGSARVVFGVVMLVLAILFIAPFFLVITNSLKTNQEYLVSRIALPRQVNLVENYGGTIHLMAYPRVLLNTALITAFSLAGLVVFGGTAAYKLARVPGRVSTVIFFIFLSIMVVPFQAVMIPIVVMAKNLALINSVPGMVVLYWALCAPPAIFLYHGFVKSIPLEIEESVRMDGAGGLRLFFFIVFPLLKPVTATVGVLMGLQIWNDFLLPLLMLQKPMLYTLTLSSMRFFQTYNTAWSNVLAAIILGCAPIVILFFLLQRYVISGVMTGATKG
ncbi:MAG TPA: carbohydrate ABC transporter permease [Spirochaetia bacterium]|nr:carbohydrate ABC transporter permease [Spirochaetia bacterium]